TGHSATVTNLPNTGTIWVRYWTLFGSTWAFTDQQYTMNVSAVTAPPITSPAPGSTLTTNSVTFTGGHTASDPHPSPPPLPLPAANAPPPRSALTGHSATVTNLPNTGTIWVRYWTLFGSTWAWTDQQYTMNVSAAPPITSPTPGSTLTSNSVTFTGGHTAS